MISTAWKGLLLWQLSISGGEFEQERAGEKRRGDFFVLLGGGVDYRFT